MNSPREEKASRILVVDDDPIHRTIVTSVLSSAGYECLEADDGAMALEVFRTNPVDLVVTDMVMENLNGLELLKTLLEDSPELPVIAVSGISADKLNLSARFGAHTILVKPVDPEELLREVERALAGLGPELMEPI